MSLSSTTVTLTPHSSVWTSRISRMFVLILSVSESVSSRVWRPTTARRVVWAIWLIAAETFSIASIERTASSTVRDRGHADADVVAGDDPLRFDRHRDDPQRHAAHAVDQRNDEDHAGSARAFLDATQPELHAALVLLDYVEADHFDLPSFVRGVVVWLVSV